MSQIGYMMLAAGLGPAGYVFAIAHLIAHGFFKAGLFLGAGSVKHEMNDEVDMRRFGGLAKVMPITFVTFGLGYLAIIGVPPFSGFFTKDPIIDAAFAKGGVSGALLGTAALIGAGITAFYMTRVMFMTFANGRRWDDGVHPHEAPPIMTSPMIVLAIGSVGGWRLPDPRQPAAEFPRPGDRRAPDLARHLDQVRRHHAGARGRSAPPSPGRCTAGARSRSPPRRAIRSPWPPARTCTATPSTRAC